MKRTLIALVALASTSVFAQSATINGEVLTRTPDTVIAPQTQCQDVECFLQNTNINHLRKGTDVLVTSTEDAIIICDFARSVGASGLLTLTVNNAGRLIIIGKCK